MNNPNRILISEDTAMWQSIFHKLLSTENFEVVPAKDLKTTIEALEQFFFNVVVVDLALDPTDESRLDGIDTMKTIFRLNEGTEAIVLTGKGTIELAVSSLRDFHIYHFLEKERFDADDFLRLVREANSKAYMKALAPGRFAPPETMIGEQDWPRLASQLQVSRNDLEYVVCALVRESMPIKYKERRLTIALDASKSFLTIDFWSKWFGKGVQIRAGKSGRLPTVEDSQLVDKRDLGKLSAVIVASGVHFERYIS